MKHLELAAVADRKLHSMGLIQSGLSYVPEIVLRMVVYKAEREKEARSQMDFLERNPAELVEG